MREAVLIESPNRQYRSIMFPTMPAIHEPANTQQTAVFRQLMFAIVDIRFVLQVQMCVFQSANVFTATYTGICTQ